MIGRLVEAAARRAERADATLHTDETLVLGVRDGRVVHAEASQEAGTSLRVVAGGRQGTAGASEADDTTLVELALASAAVGEPVELLLPGPAPLPRVLTHVPRAAAADVRDLEDLATTVTARLARSGRSVGVTVERSVGSVHLANSRGVEAGYDVTRVALEVELAQAGDDPPRPLVAHLAGADLPAPAELEALVLDLERRAAWSARTAAAPRGGVPVLLLPGAVAALLAPVRAALLGRTVVAGASPLGEAAGTRRFHADFTLRDEPLLDGRPASRPVDDEGVVCWSQALVEGGVVRGFLWDLETGANAGRPATGHARRGTFGKPRTAFSNLVVAPGELSFEALLDRVHDGLVVDAVGGTASIASSGAFQLPVLAGWRLEAGEIAGRVEDAGILGNVFDVLTRLIGVGRDLAWHGSVAAPPLVVDGIVVGPA